MYRDYTENFKDEQLDELVKEGVLVSYTYEAKEDYQTLRLTLPQGPNGEFRDIYIQSSTGVECSSLSVEVY